MEVGITPDINKESKIAELQHKDKQPHSSPDECVLVCFHSFETFVEMEQNNLRCWGLFLNADAGFDFQKFKELCDEREISHNIDINKRNWKSLLFRIVLAEHFLNDLHHI